MTQRNTENKNSLKYIFQLETIIPVLQVGGIVPSTDFSLYLTLKCPVDLRDDGVSEMMPQDR